MKAVKIIGGIVLILVVLVLVLGIIGPKHTGTMKESIYIEAPKAMIWPQVSNYQEFIKWSPWEKKDTAMTKTYEGEMGQIGAFYSWTSTNPDVGNGSMKVLEIEPEKRVTSEMRFDIGITEIVSETSFHLKDSANGTMVTWDIGGEIPFLFRPMALFSGNMNETARPDFKNGLKALKKRTEKMAANAEPSQSADYTMNEVPMESKATFLGMKGDSISDFQAFFAKGLPATSQALAKAKIQPESRPMAAYTMWYPESQTGDVLAGMMVPNGTYIEGFDTLIIPKGKVILTQHMGDYNGLGAAHEAIEKYIKEKGYKAFGVGMEEYVTDPSTVSSPEEIETIVSYVVQLNDASASQE